MNTTKMKSDSWLGLLIKIPLMFIGVLLDVIIILWVIEHFTGRFCKCECTHSPDSEIFGRENLQNIGVYESLTLGKLPFSQWNSDEFILNCNVNQTNRKGRTFSNGFLYLPSF